MSLYLHAAVRKRPKARQNINAILFLTKFLNWTAQGRSVNTVLRITYRGTLKPNWQLEPQPSDRVSSQQAGESLMNKRFNECALTIFWRQFHKLSQGTSAYIGHYLITGSLLTVKETKKHCLCSK